MAIFSSRLLLPTQSKLNSLSSRLSSILNHIQPSPETVVLTCAVLIGCATGTGVVTFQYLIKLIHSLMLEDLVGKLAVWGHWTLACIPALGGLIVGLMRLSYRNLAEQLSPLQSTQGLQEVSPFKTVAKAIAASVSLGTGASLGPEAPSVEIGANFGILLGQVLKVSRQRHRLLLGAGAAAGLAAGFNAPIAGVFFALEVVLGTTFANEAVSVVVLSAVVAALISRIGLGAHPDFAIPVYQVRSPLELLLYLGLGLLASLVSLTYTQAIQLAQRCFQGEVIGFTWLLKIPQVMHPVIGGACVGLVALQFPQILGIGYETVDTILKNEPFSLQLLCALLVVKLIVTALSLGSGLVGGIFAPAMFLGAVLGAIYGNVLAMVPVGFADIANPPAYAIVGMAAVLAGSVKAPLTAILLLFELTQNYLIILPAMAAVGLSVWLVEQLKPISIHGLDFQQMGMNLNTEDELEVLQQVPVAAVMHRSYLTLPNSMSVLEAGYMMTNGNRQAALVLDKASQVVGIVTLTDIDRAVAKLKADSLSSNLLNQKLSDICTNEILYAYEDESVAEALTRMAARGLHQLPVVARDNQERVLGLLEQEAISFACRVAVTREALSPYLSMLPMPSLQKPSIEENHPTRG